MHTSELTRQATEAVLAHKGRWINLLELLRGFSPLYSPASALAEGLSGEFEIVDLLTGLARGVDERLAQRQANRSQRRAFYKSVRGKEVTKEILDDT